MRILDTPRHAQRALALTLLLIAPFIVYAGAESEAQAAPVSLTAATVDYFEGDVTVDGQEAFLGMTVAPGATVEVGENALCEVVFGKNIIRVYAETSAMIDIGAVTSTIAVDRGAIGAVFDALQEVGNDGNLQFRTPTAVGGVRGTVFYVRVEDEDRTFVCVCNGTVGLASAAGGDEQVIAAAHHSGLRFIRNADGTIGTEIPEMAYHDDVEMDDLASRIAAPIDWTSVE